MFEVDLDLITHRYRAAHEAGHATIALANNIEMNHVVIDSKHINGICTGPHASLSDVKLANALYYAGGIAGVIFVDRPYLLSDDFYKLMEKNLYFMYYFQGSDSDIKHYKRIHKRKDNLIVLPGRVKKVRSSKFCYDRTLVPVGFLEEVFNAILAIRKNRFLFSRLFRNLILQKYLGPHALDKIRSNEPFSKTTNTKDYEIYRQR